MAHIGFDLDSVIFPLEKDIDPFFEECGFAHDGEETKWEIWEHYDLDEFTFWQTMAKGIKQGRIFKDTPPYPLTVPALTQFVQDGHYIYLITSRNIPNAELEARMATFKWINTFLPLPWSGIIVHGNKALLPLLTFVDDSIPNLQNLRDNGIIPVCYSQPWNTEWDGIRCDNLWEYYEIVNEILSEQE